MIKIESHSGMYTLKAEQFIPISIDVIWNFFSNPANLSEITPANMAFEITSGTTKSAYPGQIITYKLGILPGIKTNWVTEITQLEKGSYFIDEQRYGPYSMWHHEHWFEKVEGGTLMYDKVSYKMPLGFIGRMVHKLFVKSQLITIFSYRFQSINQIMNNKP